MRLIRTANNAQGKAIVVEDRDAGRMLDIEAPRLNEGGRWLVVPFAPGQSTGWHAVHCVVYVMVVEGQLAFALDGGETLTVRAGDCIIEGDNTLHSWTNTGETVAVVSAFELDLP